MCGSASISWRMKSSCEPSISAAIMIEKPTPVATPATATSVWRARKRTWVQGDVEDEVHRRAAPRLLDTRTRPPSARSAGRGRGHPFALGEARTGPPPRACRGCRSRPARRRTRSPSTTNTRRALHRVGRDQQRARLLARHHVRLDAHADLERRVVGQRDANAVGLGDRIAHRRDLAHLALEPPAGEGIGAQQHRLADGDARNVLLVDLGHHLQRLRHADPEQDLAGLGDLADLAVPAQHHAVHGRGDGVVVELLHLHRDQRLDLAQVGRDALVGLGRGRRRGRSAR